MNDSYQDTKQEHKLGGSWHVDWTPCAIEKFVKMSEDRLGFSIDTIV